MAQHEDKYLEYCAAYILGALDGNELREFEAHLNNGCPVCEQEMASLAEIVAKLPSGLPQLTPPRDLEHQIMDKVHLSARAKLRVGERTKEYQAVVQPPRPWTAMALGIGLILIVLAFALSYRSMMRTIDEKNQTIVSQSTQITQLKDEIQRKEEILKVLESRRIDVVTMNGLQVNPVGYGKIIWDPEKKVAILQVANLPTVPKGKDYQLWVIKNNDPHPVSAGVFAVENEDQIENYFKVQPLSVVDKNEITAFAVTLEPKGGMPQPTGDMYLLGKAAAN